jgi:AI-2 transport protein TqsA
LEPTQRATPTPGSAPSDPASRETRRGAAGEAYDLPLGPVDRERRVRTVCLVILTAIAVGATLYALQDVMVPFALASFLAIALAPVVDGLSVRTRLSRPISVGLTMLLGALVLAILGGVVASSIREFQASPFADETALETVRETASDVGGEAGLDAIEDGTAGESAFARAILARLGFDPEGTIGTAIRSASGRLEATIPALVGILGGILGQGVTVLVILMFLLVEQHRSEPRAGTSGGPAPIGDTVREKVKRYISVKVLTSMVTGIAVGLVLWIVGAPMPVLLGLLTFLLNFIPTIGSIVAVALPIPLLFATDASVTTIVLALALPSVIQFVVGQIWENKLLGDAFDLRASVVLLALVFWGKVWGVIGMLLATPITAVLKTLMEEWEMTRGIARAMGQARRSGSSPAAAPVSSPTSSPGPPSAPPVGGP